MADNKYSTYYFDKKTRKIIEQNIDKDDMNYSNKSAAARSLIQLGDIKKKELNRTNNV